MAGASLLTLIDDIAALLDDVAVLTKKATAKTAGVLGDDLALNAQQVTGVSVDRELPVVWAVAKGSAVNKLILVPLALAISVFAPWLVTPLLIVGGLFLCFEGAEKLLHAGAKKDGGTSERETVDEKTRIRGAIRTDFILSAEIIAITLGTVTDQPMTTQALVLSAIAVLMTVGVYGLVAGIVKLDDLGLYLSQRENGLARGIGRGILSVAPWLMKFLSIAGTTAMFLVGGGIIVHGIPVLHHWLEGVLAHVSFLGFWGKMIGEGLVGLAAGMVLALIFTAFQKMRGKPAH